MNLDVAFDHANRIVRANGVECSFADVVRAIHSLAAGRHVREDSANMLIEVYDVPDGGFVVLDGVPLPHVEDVGAWDFFGWGDVRVCDGGFVGRRGGHLSACGVGEGLMR